MILTDAGPLIALADRGEPAHQRCLEALTTFTGPLLTTWPVLTEAMHVLGSAGGWRAQRAVWSLVAQDLLVLGEISSDATARIPVLMEKYSDRLMDLGNASLVALAEELGLDQVFTLDSDFHIYRSHGTRAFTVIP